MAVLFFCSRRSFAIGEDAVLLFAVKELDCLQGPCLALRPPAEMEDRFASLRSLTGSIGAGRKLARDGDVVLSQAGVELVDLACCKEPEDHPGFRTGRVRD